MTGSDTSDVGRVFLSYSRRESAFSDDLILSIQSYGFEVLYDRDDLFPGEPWEPRLHHLITSADTTLCVISQNWLASEQCRKELAIALEHGRRIIPILIEALDPDTLPAELSHVQFVLFHGPKQTYARGVVDLIDALKTDIEWVRYQTRLLDRSTYWNDAGKNAGLLLGGHELDDAMAWLERRPSGNARVLPQVAAFVEESRSKRDRERRTKLFRRIGATLGVLLLATTATSVYAVYLATTQRQEALLAEERANVAQVEQDNARLRAELATRIAERAELDLAVAERGAPTAPEDFNTEELVLDLISNETPVRRNARSKIVGVINAAQDPAFNQDFVETVLRISDAQPENAYRLQIGMAYAVSQDGVPFPVVDKAKIVRQLNDVRSKANDAPLQNWIDRAIQNIENSS